MKLTREGRRFLLAAFLIAVAAVNTGNNLIYLILSLMLSFIVLSFIILRLNLSSLEPELSVDSHLFAGERVCCQLLVYNNKKTPSYSLNIEAPGVSDRIYCGMVQAKGVFKADICMVFKKRGLYRQTDFSIQSGFPFILFTKKTVARISGEVLVYPALLDLEHFAAEIESFEDQGEAALTGSGDDLYSLRQYQQGDDRRRIHWKASARQSKLLVREYAEYASRNITILADNLIPSDGQSFEKVVSAAASLAKYFIEKRYLVRLISAGKVVPFGSGEEHLFTILDVLAMLEEVQPGMINLPSEEVGMVIAVVKSGQSAILNQGVSVHRIIHADSL